jgi:hypothetical protein
MTAELKTPPSPEIRPLDKSERLTLGRRAQALLDDDLLNAVFEAVANAYRKQWENAPRGDHETQHTAHLSLSALKDVQGAIRLHLANAKLFEADLKAKKVRQETARLY